MNNHKHKIVLNGKIYDVKTGQAVAGHHESPKQESAPQNNRVMHQKVIDGVITKPKGHLSHQNHHKPVFNSHSPPPKTINKAQTQQPTPVGKTSSHAPHNVNHVKKHHPLRAATLMRSVVSPPPDNATVMRAEQNKIVLTDKEGRLHRAKTIKKSQHIQRFPVSPQSAEEFIAPPIIPVSKAVPATVTHQVLPENHNKVMAETRAVKTKQEKIFEKAIENANSHKKIPRSNHQKHHRSKISPKRRTFRYASGMLAAVLLTSFVLYQNIPNLSMRIASSKAGFDASLPGYSPSGYALSGPVVYSPGKITVNFSSNSDDRDYSLTEQVSNWNSQALIDNYLVAKNKNYQTYQEKGKTIFLYDDKNATWVSGGVWYQIEDADELSSSQILNIASST